MTLLHKLNSLIETWQLYYVANKGVDKRAKIHKAATLIATDCNDINRNVYVVNVQLMLANHANVAASQSSGHADRAIINLIG